MNEQQLYERPPTRCIRTSIGRRNSPELTQANSPRDISQIQDYKRPPTRHIGSRQVNYRNNLRSSTVSPDIFSTNSTENCEIQQMEYTKKPTKFGYMKQELLQVNEQSKQSPFSFIPEVNETNIQKYPMLRNQQIGMFKQFDEKKINSPDLRNRSRSPEQIVKNTKLRAVYFKNLEHDKREISINRRNPRLL